ncbi:UNVERIFIED_CONTAM: hypothetical protein Sangu_0831000 [Sesamum angustifolium]|uniref:Uncharacterized protein n=1 Tax=Sesamum angustifolium TaxID=2727405 RepID=A0AAW2PWB2_9LAMI
MEKTPMRERSNYPLSRADMQRMIYEASRKAIVEYERRTITLGMRDMKSQLFTRREIDAEMGNEVPGEPEKDREQELSDESLSRRVAPRPPGFSKVEVDDVSKQIEKLGLQIDDLKMRGRSWLKIGIHLLLIKS